MTHKLPGASRVRALRRSTALRRTGATRRSSGTIRRNPYTTQKKALRDKCDAIWQQVVVARAGGVCAICGRRYNLAGHHIVPRSQLFTRHDPENGLCVCVFCHKRIHIYPEWFKLWLESHRPAQALYWHLHRNDHEPFRDDYKVRYGQLKMMLEGL